MRILILLLFPLFSYSQLSIGILESSRFAVDSTAPKAFITAAGITDGTQISAIYSLAFGLQQDGLWGKMKAIYPFVGGTASAHKFNLKDPRDLDAAFRLLFVGGWTHSSTGALPNGTSGYANTYLQPDNQSLYSNVALSYYSRTNTATSDRTEIGSYGNAANLFKAYAISISRASLSMSWFHDGNNALDRASGSNSISTGFYVATRISTTDNRIFKNASQLGINNTTALHSLLTNNAPIYIAASNLDGTGAIQFSNRECAFASISSGLTSAEVSNLYTRVQAFQTALSRQL
jgi:hypothetical protein